MVEREGAPALQVIILGSGGGPLEDNTTAFLVRSIAAGWKKGSVLAVDAGVHLSAVYKILENHLPKASGDPPNSPWVLTSGPFAGLELPFTSLGANAAHITHHMIDTYLITHPHLDHISGFVVNTAGLHDVKTLAGLPATIDAFKTHIFNNIIWPNLSDIGGGAGLITYLSLFDGGHALAGTGEGIGYVEISEGLSTRAMSISHGNCVENHSHGRDSTQNEAPSSPRPSSNALSATRSLLSEESIGSRKSIARTPPCVYDSTVYFLRDIATGSELLIFGDVEPDEYSQFPRNAEVWATAAPRVAAGLLKAIFIECSYSDHQAAYRLFGHLAPRFLINEVGKTDQDVDSDQSGRKRKRPSYTHRGSLDDPIIRRSNRNNSGAHKASDYQNLRGPRLQTDGLRRQGRNHSHADSGASMSPAYSPMTSSTSNIAKSSITDRSLPKSNPSASGSSSPMAIASQNGSRATRTSDASPPVAAPPSNPGELNTLANEVLAIKGPSSEPLLKGLKIIIIHVKDTLDDGPPAGEIIMSQLRAHEAIANLGCEFILAEPGMSVYV